MLLDLVVPVLYRFFPVPPTLLNCTVGFHHIPRIVKYLNCKHPYSLPQEIREKMVQGR